jgi:predicted nuclease of predicted toxin-antitoxin system
MRLLLDQSLPRSTVHNLHAGGVESAHVGGKGLANASDAKILDFARQGGWIVVTLDADSHALSALSGATSRHWPNKAELNCLL